MFIVVSSLRSIVSFGINYPIDTSSCCMTCCKNNENAHEPSCTRARPAASPVPKLADPHRPVVYNSRVHVVVAEQPEVKDQSRISACGNDRCGPSPMLTKPTYAVAPTEWRAQLGVYLHPADRKREQNTVHTHTRVPGVWASRVSRRKGRAICRPHADTRSVSQTAPVPASRRCYTKGNYKALRAKPAPPVILPRVHETDAKQCRCTRRVAQTNKNALRARSLFTPAALVEQTLEKETLTREWCISYADYDSDDRSRLYAMAPACVCISSLLHRRTRTTS